jgi:hypothetical protein
MFQLLDIKLEDKRFRTEWEQALPDFSLLLISSWIEPWFVKVVPKNLNFSTFSEELLSIFILWLLPACPNPLAAGNSAPVRTFCNFSHILLFIFVAQQRYSGSGRLIF